MRGFYLRPAGQADFQELARWLVEVSQLPEQHCLHTWSGQSADTLYHMLSRYWDDGELAYVVALQDDRLVGAVGGEYDQELGRGWLHGPHATGRQWQAIAAGLFTALLAELPACLRQLHAYLNVENVRGRRFYSQCGFRERENLSYEFWLTPAERVASHAGGCGLCEERHAASFVQLYEDLFPAAYYRGERVLQMIGDSHQVFVLAEGSEVLGFAVVSVAPSLSEGEIQFLGVREDCRGRGYGRLLLLAAIDWLLDQAGVPRISLNVDAERIRARRLYERVGFTLRFTGVGLRKEFAAEG